MEKTTSTHASSIKGEKDGDPSETIACARGRSFSVRGGGWRIGALDLHNTEGEVIHWRPLKGKGLLLRPNRRGFLLKKRRKGEIKKWQKPPSQGHTLDKGNLK